MPHMVVVALEQRADGPDYESELLARTYVEGLLGSYHLDHELVVGSDLSEHDLPDETWRPVLRASDATELAHEMIEWGLEQRAKNLRTALASVSGERAAIDQILDGVVPASVVGDDGVDGARAAGRLLAQVGALLAGEWTPLIGIFDVATYGTGDVSDLLERIQHRPDEQVLVVVGNIAD
jgi:hypothetical protein